MFRGLKKLRVSMLFYLMIIKVHSHLGVRVSSVESPNTNASHLGLTNEHFMLS